MVPTPSALVKREKKSWLPSLASLRKAQRGALSFSGQPVLSSTTELQSFCSGEYHTCSLRSAAAAGTSWIGATGLVAGLDAVPGSSHNQLPSSRSGSALVF